MTYGAFLLLFLVTPIAVLRRRLLLRRFTLPAAARPGLLAPWDHTAAVWGLWT
jgi:hypothetical protein